MIEEIEKIAAVFFYSGLGIWWIGSMVPSVTVVVIGILFILFAALMWVCCGGFDWLQRRKQAKRAAAMKPTKLDDFEFPCKPPEGCPVNFPSDGSNPYVKPKVEIEVDTRSVTEGFLKANLIALKDFKPHWFPVDENTKLDGLGRPLPRFTSYDQPLCPINLYPGSEETDMSNEELQAAGIEPPQHVLACADVITAWFAENNLKNWKLGALQSRDDMPSKVYYSYGLDGNIEIGEPVAGSSEESEFIESLRKRIRDTISSRDEIQAELDALQSKVESIERQRDDAFEATAQAFKRINALEEFRAQLRHFLGMEATLVGVDDEEFEPLESPDEIPITASERFVRKMRELRDFAGPNSHLEDCQAIIKDKLHAKNVAAVTGDAIYAGISLVEQRLLELREAKRRRMKSLEEDDDVAE